MHVVAAMLLVLLLLIGCTRGHGEPLDGHVCVDVGDCPPAPACHDVECVVPQIAKRNTVHEYAGDCTYTRQNISECCMTSDECCEYAAPHQVGICDKNCTCQFVSSLQCRTDDDCAGLHSSIVCRAQGPCFTPMCEAGLCQCHNGTGLDLDDDGVPCPDDCDDTDPYITTELTCVRDRDNDHFPDCPPFIVSADDDEDEDCMVFCVEPNHTCPYGYADVSDAERQEKQRSRRRDTGAPCDELPAIDEEDCDCCDRDKRAYPGSLYSASTLNNCGNADYDCNGVADNVTCCVNGTRDYYYAHYPTSSRYLWFTNVCTEDTRVCGGCSTVNGSAVLVGGYACETNCTGDEITSVAAGMCPNACDNECECVDADSPPMIGDCTKVVTSCIHVRSEPVLYGDHEACCVAAVH